MCFSLLVLFVPLNLLCMRIRVEGGGSSALHSLLLGMFNFLSIEIGSTVYQQTIGIPMGTDCAPLVVTNFFSYVFEFNP